MRDSNHHQAALYASAQQPDLSDQDSLHFRERCGEEENDSEKVCGARVCHVHGCNTDKQVGVRMRACGLLRLMLRQGCVICNDPLLPYVPHIVIDLVVYIINFKNA